jgi:hypothetical protein
MLGLNPIPRSDVTGLMTEFRNSVNAFVKEQWKKTFEIWIDLAMDQLGGFTKTASWLETTNTWDADKAIIKFNVHYERGKEVRMCFSGNVLANTMTAFVKSRDYEMHTYIRMDDLISLKSILVKEFEKALK